MCGYFTPAALLLGILITGRGGRNRALGLLVLETGTNACTGRDRFSLFTSTFTFTFTFYFIFINLNNNEFTIDKGYAAVETHSKSSIINLF